MLGLRMKLGTREGDMSPTLGTTRGLNISAMGVCCSMFALLMLSPYRGDLPIASKFAFVTDYCRVSDFYLVKGPGTCVSGSFFLERVDLMDDWRLRPRGASLDEEGPSELARRSRTPFSLSVLAWLLVILGCLRICSVWRGALDVLLSFLNMLALKLACCYCFLP